MPTVSTISRPRLLVVHSVYRLYPGKRVCAQCIHTVQSVYKPRTVSTNYAQCPQTIRIHVYVAYASGMCIRVYVHAYTCIRVYTRIRTYLPDTKLHAKSFAFFRQLSAFTPSIENRKSGSGCDAHGRASSMPGHSAWHAVVGRGPRRCHVRRHRPPAGYAHEVSNAAVPASQPPHTGTHGQKEAAGDPAMA